MRKTKIVSTLGPATFSKEAIKELIKSGVDIFRLNFSHGDYETHKKVISLIREAENETNSNIAVMQDISGPKIRIGEVEGRLKLKRGDKIKLTKNENHDRFSFTLSYSEIIDMVNVDEEIYFADGTIRTIVIEKSEDELILELLTDGVLSSRKGVNFPHTKLNIDIITPKDINDLKFGAEIGVDVVALSFVHNKDDILKAREILKSVGSEKFIISKIETKFAIENLDEIVEYSDGLMVARGDLGAELGLERVPNIQKEIIKKANLCSKPVITATQMLMSMIKSPYPTRAEVSDVANAVFDGSDAVMLSDETTIGEFPFKAVEVLDKTITEAEKSYNYYPDLTPSKNNVLAKAAVDVSKSLNPDAIVSFTTTGFTARNIAKFRPQKDIYALTWDEKTYKELKLSWGIKPILIENRDNSILKMIYSFVHEMKNRGLLNENSSYIATMGYITSNQHNTNLLRIIDKNMIENIEELIKKI